MTSHREVIKASPRRNKGADSWRIKRKSSYEQGKTHCRKPHSRKQRQKPGHGVALGGTTSCWACPMSKPQIRKLWDTQRERSARLHGGGLIWTLRLYSPNNMKACKCRWTQWGGKKAVVQHSTRANSELCGEFCGLQGEPQWTVQRTGAGRMKGGTSRPPGGDTEPTPAGQGVRRAGRMGRESVKRSWTPTLILTPSQTWNGLPNPVRTHMVPNPPFPWSSS